MDLRSYALWGVVFLVGVGAVVSALHVSALSEELSFTESQKRYLEGQVADLSQFVASQRVELNRLYEQVDDLNEDVLECQKDLNYYRRNLVSCRLDLREYRAEISEYEQNLSVCAEEVNKVLADLNSCNVLLSDCNAELIDCQRDRDSYRKSLRSCRNRLSACYSGSSSAIGTMDDYIQELTNISPASLDMNAEMLEILDNAVNVNRPHSDSTTVNYANINIPGSVDLSVEFVLPVYIRHKEEEGKRVCVDVGGERKHILIWYCDRMQGNLSSYLGHIQNKRSELVSSGVFASDADVNDVIAQVQEFNNLLNVLCTKIGDYADLLNTSCQIS